MKPPSISIINLKVYVVDPNHCWGCNRVKQPHEVLCTSCEREYRLTGLTLTRKIAPDPRHPLS